MYSKIIDYCQLSSKDIVLDLCCGTGGIGICLSHKVKKVIGIEMCKSAVEDAINNTKINNINNCFYVCNKVENVISDLLTFKTEFIVEKEEDNLVAIVDPPRCGLHQNVIKCLRKCSKIKKLIYVSCNPTESLLNDLESLCMIEDKNNKGKPFYPVKCIGVDLFPHTNHCEMIMLFNRI